MAKKKVIKNKQKTPVRSNLSPIQKFKEWLTTNYGIKDALQAASAASAVLLFALDFSYHFLPLFAILYLAGISIVIGIIFWLYYRNLEMFKIHWFRSALIGGIIGLLGWAIGSISNHFSPIMDDPYPVPWGFNDFGVLIQLVIVGMVIAIVADAMFPDKYDLGPGKKERERT